MSEFTLGSEYLNQSVSSGTMRDADLVNAFLGFLQSESGAEGAGIAQEFILEWNLDPNQRDYGVTDREDAGEIVNALFDTLDEIAPADTYFGAHPGDGADYGFWSSEDW